MSKSQIETSKEQAREAAFTDRQTLDQGMIYDSQAVFNALCVMILDVRIRQFLMNNDPKALEQARKALGVMG